MTDVQPVASPPARSWPRDEVETALDEAHADGDDARTLRTLARAVVCLPLPPAPQGIGSPFVVTSPPGTLPLPEVPTQHGPAVPVFTTWAEMAACCTPEVAASWMQVAVAELLSQLTTGHQLVLNPGGHAEAVLRPEHLVRLARLARGQVTLDAVRCGPRTGLLLGAPAQPRTEVLRAAAGAASAHGARALHAGQAQVAEPGAAPFVVLGVRAAPGGEQQLLDALDDALAAVTAEPVAVHLLADDAAGTDPDALLLRWLAEQPDLLEPA